MYCVVVVLVVEAVVVNLLNYVPEIFTSFIPSLALLK